MRKILLAAKIYFAFSSFFFFFEAPFFAPHAIFFPSTKETVLNLFKIFYLKFLIK
jgi:hypothetical protein